MLIVGIEALAFGAVASVCKFYSAYPMTPSAGIMNYLAGKGVEYGIVVELAEDEIRWWILWMKESFYEEVGKFPSCL